MKNAGKQNETELERVDKGNAKEKYKGKENGSKNNDMMTESVVLMSLWPPRF